MDLLLKVLAMGYRRKPAAQKWVDDRMKIGRCLYREERCDRTCEEEGGGRGRCQKHYARFRISIVNLSRESKLAIEAKLIREGSLLDNNEIRKYRKPQAAKVG